MSTWVLCHNSHVTSPPPRPTRTLELEAALLSVPEGVDVRGIAKCRPLPDELRAPAWLACLDIQQDVDDGLMTFTNIYDLPEQQLMREDIQQLVGESP